MRDVVVQPMLELILGGARSGKSREAERRAEASGLAVTYIATATVGDDEMVTRVALHRERRPAEWSLVEEPVHLAAILAAEAAADRCLLVDCLSLWVSNLLFDDHGVHLSREIEHFLRVIESLPGRIILVSSEVGLGIIPMGEVSRRYVDTLGGLHQDVAARSDRVTLMVAGLPLSVK